MFLFLVTPCLVVAVQPCMEWIPILKKIIFQVNKGLKRHKTVQNNKKFCLSGSISQESYIIWLSFMVQMCKMIISQSVFFNFKILIFQVARGTDRAKNGPKWQIFLSVAPYISRIIYHMIFVYGTHLCIKG